MEWVGLVFVVGMVIGWYGGWIGKGQENCRCHRRRSEVAEVVPARPVVWRPAEVATGRDLPVIDAEIVDEQPALPAGRF